MPRISTDISTITRTVENLSKRYGQELVLYYLRRSPNMLSCDYETLVARAEHVRSMLDLRPTEVLAVLRKNPNLFIMESSVVRTRFTSLHKVMPLNHDNVRKLVVKFPLILNYQTTSIEHLMDSLRQLSYTRVQWQQDFDAMSPSLIAFYLRDARDLLLRLEYLVATGENPHIDIKTVFKVSNNLFAKKHRNFRPWLHMREQRRQQQLLRQQGQQAQQEQALAQVRSYASAQRPSQGYKPEQPGAKLPAPTGGMQPQAVGRAPQGQQQGQAPSQQQQGERKEFGGSSRR